MNDQKIAWRDLDRANLEWHPVSVGPKEDELVAVASGVFRIRRRWAVLDDVARSVVADSMSVSRWSEADGHVMLPIVSDTT